MKLIGRITALAGAGTLALGISLSAATSAMAGGVLTAPEADWTGGQVTCKIIQIILEDHMDYKVKRITIPSGPGVMEGMRAGDLDFACESWPSYSTTKDKYVKEWKGDGTVVKLGDAGIIGISSYYVPRYLVEGEGAKAPDLKKLADLNKYVDLFKALETGDKGRLLGCPVAAWECKDAERMKLLNINFHPVELGSETAHWAEMKAAFKRKEPFVAYAWEPHWIHAALDLVPLELPKHSDEKWPATGWAKDITFNYGRPEILTEHPKAAQMITNSSLSNEQQAGMILAIDVDGKEIDDVVRQWMKTNEAIWKSWIPK